MSASTCGRSRSEQKSAREAWLLSKGHRVLAAVTEAYLEHGKMLSVADIAARLGWSESKVRRVLDAQPGGVPQGVGVLRDGRGWLYHPTSWHLRSIILEQRKTIDELKPKCPTCLKPAVAGHNGYCVECWNDRALAAGAV